MHNSGLDAQQINSYRLKHIIPGNGKTNYAAYEMNHSILAVQFYYHDRLINFCDEEPVQFMVLDEILLIRELGEITIDGISYFIESMTFNLTNGEAGCQHMIIFNLQANY